MHGPRAKAKDIPLSPLTSPPFRHCIDSTGDTDTYTPSYNSNSNSSTSHCSTHFPPPFSPNKKGQMGSSVVNIQQLEEAVSIALNPAFNNQALKQQAIAYVEELKNSNDGWLALLELFVKKPRYVCL